MDLNIILSGVISGLIGAVAMYVIAKKVSKSIVSELIEEHFDLKKLQNDEDLQKFIYAIGGLIGKGAGRGIGLDKKLNPKDIVMNMVVDWWENRNNPNARTQRRPQTQVSEEDPLRIR